MVLSRISQLTHIGHFVEEELVFVLIIPEAEPRCFRRLGVQWLPR